MGDCVKRTSTTKKRIVTAAWKLFYEQGYDNTTVEEIIFESGTSKGSFYHYFEGKDALLSSLSYLFDEKYEELVHQLTPEQDAYEKLIFLNRNLFEMIDNGISPELLTRLYSTQLTTRGEKHLLNRSRFYYKLLHKIMLEGQQADQLCHDMTVGELVKYYAMCERALIYEWCMIGGEYSLREYSAKILPKMLQSIRSPQSNIE